MKIVIIEDEKDLGVLMRNFLVKQLNIKSPDASVKVAASLLEGLECINSMKPDWVFIDNNLPDGKGINEINRIKNTNPEIGARIVMMSAMTNLREEAFREGADYFLDKPISFVEVKNILTNGSSARNR
ncbi:response regulator [Dyadobacter sp. CY326]|uniref:response regulator n=1 Tax=Dyadobacter sp. CY326 TaxID=2907300 RepID=UPI001F486005|nr:response regulator [Dyadobacter sp. CY326]MCE7064417.1 response regulator [Dyadobacter sp. CY326]